MNQDLLIRTENYKGYKINLYYDDAMDNPIECGSFYGTLWCNHRRYLSLDSELSELTDLAEDYEMELEDYLNTEFEEWYPIYAYEHGGIALSMSCSGQFSDQFDSGLFGIVTINKEQASWFKDSDKIYDAVKSSIKELQAYMNGDGYAVETINPCGDLLHVCGGFLDEDEAIEEGQSDIDYDISTLDTNYQVIALRQDLDKVKETLRNQYITKNHIIDAMEQALSEEEIRKILFEISKHI